MSTKNGGFLTMGYTTHPYASALNLAYVNENAISFRTGTAYGNAGD
jgi:hypothetical protein